MKNSSFLYRHEYFSFDHISFFFFFENSNIQIKQIRDNKIKKIKNQAAIMSCEENLIKNINYIQSKNIDYCLLLN